MQADLQALAHSGIISRIVTCGGGENVETKERERELLEHLRVSGGFEQRGLMEEREVSLLLSEASFAISAQNELSLTKSGTFMAYASHGLNILSPFAGAAKPEPLCWLTSPAELLEAPSLPELPYRAHKLRDWQQRTASWPHIARQLATALRPGD
jgi:hypothetical protein